MTQEIKDSGDRQQFPTGAVRDTDTNKPRPALISPLFALRLSAWLAKGALKYSARNWEKGIPIERSFDSLLRHLMAWWSGDESEDHLAAAACNLMFIIHTEEAIRRGLLPKELGDRPNYRDRNVYGSDGGCGHIISPLVKPDKPQAHTYVKPD